MLMIDKENGPTFDTRKQHQDLAMQGGTLSAQKALPMESALSSKEMSKDLFTVTFISGRTGRLRAEELTAIIWRRLTV